jgi:transposase-like protein
MLNQNHPSLTEVQNAFAHWRTHRQPRETPPELRAQAVHLLARYSVTEVMNALHVDYRQLSRWRREVSVLEAGLPDSDFVELPAAVAPPVTAVTLTRYAADGSAVSISAELSEAQWGWALKLLQETTS